MERLGIVVGGPLATIGSLAARAEAAGLGHVWLHEAGHDVTVAAAVVAGATSRVSIGTDVAVAFARTPTLAAFGAWDLQELSHGRFVLGLGSQVRAVVEEAFGAAFSPPAARMAEYLQAVRAAFATLQGRPTTFEGEHLRLARPAPYVTPAPERPVPPLMLAAVGPAMTATAATHADGILGHPFTTPRFVTERLVPRVEAALAEAGRRRTALTIATGVIVEAHEDREAARTAARRQVAFYGTTRNYAEVFAVNGHEELTQACRAHLRDHGTEGLHEVVGDDVLDLYAVAGTPAEVRAGLAGWHGLADHLILTPPSNARRGEEVVVATGALLDALADPTTADSTTADPTAADAWA